MSNISSRINLRQLKSHVLSLKGNSGMVKGIFIPITENSLYEGEKGIYLDMMGFELKERKADRKDTHLVKQSFPKEVYEAMTDQDRKDAPILGNMIVWGYQEPAPVEFEITDLTVDPLATEGNDLPF